MEEITLTLNVLELEMLLRAILDRQELQSLNIFEPDAASQFRKDVFHKIQDALAPVYEARKFANPN